MSVPNIRLNNGVSMPQLGFGVFQVPDAETEAAVTTAFELGYRSIDTAAGYGNEAGVGAAVARSGIPRNELFITTKLVNSEHGYDQALRAFDKSLDLLGLEQLDLYLVHWPRPAVDKYVETWRAFEKLLADGRVRAIGVSNFQPAHLRRVIDETGTVPAVNQIELHPYLTQTELRDVDAKLTIATEAWSPLAKGGDLLSEPLLTGLADKYGRTAAQIVLRWHIQLGNVVIPKSVTPSRMKENIEVFDFELAEDDMEGITAMDRGLRTGPDPDTFN
jgi:2,5-diketo-D-gluconate reductase A